MTSPTERFRTTSFVPISREEQQQLVGSRTILNTRDLDSDSSAFLGTVLQLGTMTSRTIAAPGLGAGSTNAPAIFGSSGIGQDWSEWHVQQPDMALPVGAMYALGTTTPWLSHRLAPSKETEIRLSPEILSRVLNFVSWLPDWDGSKAERIDPDIAQRALLLVNAMGSIAGEPNVSPGSDGTLLLEWSFEDGSAIEVYVEDSSGFPDCAVIEDETGEISEVPLRNEDHLARLLARRSSAGVAE